MGSRDSEIPPTGKPWRILELFGYCALVSSWNTQVHWFNRGYGIRSMPTTFWVSLVLYPTYGLESLAIVERIPAERTWVAWWLTELGKAEGKDIIRRLNLNLSE